MSRDDLGVLSRDADACRRANAAVLLGAHRLHFGPWGRWKAGMASRYLVEFAESLNREIFQAIRDDASQAP